MVLNQSINQNKTYTVPHVAKKKDYLWARMLKLLLGILLNSLVHIMLLTELCRIHKVNFKPLDAT